MSTARHHHRLTGGYLDIRARQLEGTYPGDPQSGTWPISVNRVMFGWGSVMEQDFPVEVTPENWPPPEPPGLDEAAKANRTGPYYRIRDATDCTDALRTPLDVGLPGMGWPVSASVEITDEWIDPPGGIIPLEAGTSPTVGSHGFHVAKVTEAGLFAFPNSWGEEWGDDGWGYLPPEVFDRRLISAHALLPSQETPLRPGAGIELIAWGDRTHRGETLHAVAVYDRSNDDRLGWAFAVERGKRIEVEELFVRPHARGRGHGSALYDSLRETAFRTGCSLRFWIPFADSEPANRPRLRRFFKRFGFGVAPSGVRWAPYAASRDLPAKAIADVPFPEKPARSLAALREERASEPDWDAAGLDPAVAEAAKAVFRRRRELLKRLA